MPPSSDASNWKSIVVAACDLDKTLYPPEGPTQKEQLRSNLQAMLKFEELGGFVFPVTGNNLLLAQRKFDDPDEPGKKLRDVATAPGIFTNGALLLGPGGKELERHSLGELRQEGNPDTNFITALVDFFDNPENKKDLLRDVGLCFLTLAELAGYKEAFTNLEGYADSQRVPVECWSKEKILEKSQEVLLVLLLFPPLLEAPREKAVEEYNTKTRPWQQRVEAAMKDQNLTRYLPADSGGSGDAASQESGIVVTLMKDPWPEMDISVRGVNKGKALAALLRHKEVLKYLGEERVDPATQVAVFGDAQNDVPMFLAVDGVKPGLRVRMPHADNKALLEAANECAEVSETLEKICEAKRAR